MKTAVITLLWVGFSVPDQDRVGFPELKNWSDEDLWTLRGIPVRYAAADGEKNAAEGKPDVLH